MFGITDIASLNALTAYLLVETRAAPRHAMIWRGARASPLKQAGVASSARIGAARGRHRRRNNHVRGAPATSYGTLALALAACARALTLYIFSPQAALTVAAGWRLSYRRYQPGM